jgi:hypothetical protein
VEHHRTPQRKRNYRVGSRGHVLKCGSVLPLLAVAQKQLLGGAAYEYRAFVAADPAAERSIQLV